MNEKMTKENLIEYGLKLEHIISREDITSSTEVIEILKILQSLEVDPHLIRNARIIIAINKLRKYFSDKEVIKLSKSLLKFWKKTVISENALIRDYLTINQNSIANQEFERPEKIFKRIQRTRIQIEYQKILNCGTTNASRLKCRHLLSKALMSDGNNEEEFLRAARLGCHIEKCIFNEFKNTESKYKNRIRSRVSNLSDSKNIELKQNVLNGKIKVEAIAVMSAEEMASNQLKELRKKYEIDSFNANQLPEVLGSTSGLLKCPKCKKNNCTYNQVQIERADEPMTTFCLCIECGHRWKFN
jgi:transcription elongation factor S-II